MKFSYNWLKELAGIKESPQKLTEFLTLRAFEVESATKTGGDWVLDVKLLPNRVADASGHAGMAREIATLKKLKIKSQQSKVIESKTRRASDVLRVKIENPEDCPRYTARVMTAVKVKPSPAWLRQRLTVCGIQSINNVVDAANYVMLELGQPLHVFDMEKLKVKSQKSKVIVVRRAEHGEKLLALDEKTYQLTPEMLVIADELKPIAIAGIKGGKDSGVSTRTKTIVLESANFNPVRARIGSHRLGLKTDASYRFEHGMDPNQTAPAIDRLAELIQKVAGGEILAGQIDAYPRPPKPKIILLRPDRASRLIGEAIPSSFYEASFKRLGWSYAKKDGDYLVRPSTERLDLEIEEDAIEEMVRLWGYEKIRPSAPRIEARSILPNEARAWEEKIKDILVGAGFTEAYAYVFASDKLLGAFGDSPQGLLEIANPTSLETHYLSNHPARQYLKMAADNLRHNDAVSVFGIAPGFTPLDARTGGAAAASGSLRLTGFKPATRPSPEMPAKEKRYLVIIRAAKEAKGKD
ncbi:MAG: phenylalanine--tRNA ligase subunit beta, partial [Patescibacteria group bacterium]